MNLLMIFSLLSTSDFCIHATCVVTLSSRNFPISFIMVPNNNWYDFCGDG